MIISLDVPMRQWLLIGFLAGFGYMAGQDLWWFLTGMLSICRG